jgi:hypothetical protein
LGSEGAHDARIGLQFYGLSEPKYKFVFFFVFRKKIALFLLSLPKRRKTPRHSSLDMSSFSGHMILTIFREEFSFNSASICNCSQTVEMLFVENSCVAFEVAELMVLENKKYTVKWRSFGA